MLPFYKIFSLLIRVFTRPLINYTKKYHIGKNDSTHILLKRFFMKLGNISNRYETKINRRFLKITSADELFIKPLADDVALEKGVEFFYEIMFYAILIIIPTWEMYKAQLATDNKALQLENRLSTMENKINIIHKRREENTYKLNERLDSIEKTLGSNEKTSTELAKEFHDLKVEIMNIINQKKTT